MAEPARQLYDPDDEQPVTRPNLKALEGGGEDSSPPTGKLASVGKDEISPEDLAATESMPSTDHERQLGRGYTSKNKSKIKGRFSRRQKIIGLGVGGGLGAGLIGLFLFFLPMLRLESYLSSIDQRVFGFASNAVEQRAENLFGRYMIMRVIHMDKCGNKVTGKCAADYSNKGIAGSLYNTWRDAKVEQKLIDEYGLKFETHKNPHVDGGIDRITIKSTKTNTVINLTEGEIRAGKFSGGDRAFGKEVNKFLKKETRWYQVMQRRSVRKYLVRKHGAKFWCFWACKTKDAIDTKKLDVKTKFRLKLIERVVYPMSPKLGLIMDCLLSGTDGPNCSSDSFRKKGIDRTMISEDEVTDILDIVKDNPNMKLSQIMIEKLLLRVMEKETAHKTVGLIPVVGWAYLGASIIDMLDRADECLDDYCLSKYAADINSSQYLEYYTEMRKVNDETKAGVLSAAQVGAAASQFDDGGHSAGESAVYQAYTNPGKTTTALLDRKVYAASTQTTKKDPYLCANGQPIPKGELVCNEKKVTRTFTAEDIRNDSVVSGLATILNTYRCIGATVRGHCVGVSPRVVIRPLLKSINFVAETVLSPVVRSILWTAQHTPGVGGLLDKIEKVSKALLQAFLGKIFPLPVQADSPGRDRYDALEAGGEVAASEFGKGGYTDTGEPYGLGGKKLSSAEQVAILQNYNEQNNYDYQNSGLIARLTNIENPNSLASRFIASMPTSFSQLTQRFATIITKPFSGISSLWHPVFAAQTNTANIDAFGIPRFGYAVDDPALTADPSQYTEEYCKDPEQQKTWEASKTENKITGIDEYSTTNPCLLEQVAIEAASSVYTNDDSIGDGTDTSTGTYSGNCTANGIVYPGQYSQSQLEQIFGPPVRETHENLVNVSFFGNNILVNKLVAPCLKAVEQDLKAQGVTYRPEASKGGIWCIRDEDAQLGDRSYHIYGAACDINPKTNPYTEGSSAPYDMPQSYVDAFKAHGFTWGGDWHSAKDYMHFEWHGVTP